MTQKTRWTLLVYMAGDNDLESDGVRDIQEMLRVGASDEVRVIVQFDRPAATADTRRYRIPDRPGISFEDCPSDVIPETNTGDPKVLASFLSWGRKTYPADRLGLIVWNHGDGWRPLEMEDRARAVSRKPAAAPRLWEEHRPRRRAFRTFSGFRHSLFLHPRALGASIDQALAPLPYIGYDEGAGGDSLDMLELRNALEKGLSPKGRLDFLGFDACLMAQLEVVYEVRNQASVIVGSEETEPNSGWPYHLVLGALTRKPDLDPESFGVKVARAYLDDLKPRRKKGDDGNTQSVLRTASIEALALATAKLGTALAKALETHPRDILAIARDVQSYDDPDYADLGDLAKLARKNVRSADIATASTQILKALDDVVVYQGALGPGVQSSTGITVYLPTNRIELRANRQPYSQLAFCREHPGWLQFLDRLHAHRTRLAR